MVSKHKKIDAGNLDLSKRSHKVLPLIEKVKVLKKGNKSLLRSIARTNIANIVVHWDIHFHVRTFRDRESILSMGKFYYKKII